MQFVSRKHWVYLPSQMLFSSLIFFCFLIPAAAGAGTEIRVTADEQFRYAEDCFSKEDYRCAESEFKRFVFFFPQDERKERATYQIGLSLYRSGSYREAIRFFHQFQEDFGDTGYTGSASFLIARAYLALDRKGDAIISLNNLAVWATDWQIKDLAYYELGWIWLEQPSYRLSVIENEMHANSYFNKISPEGQEELHIPELKDELKKYAFLPAKNPVLAGSLSIVPGLGQLYCERYQDSITAFLLNFALGFAAYEAFDHENYALGGLISVVGSGFYVGNIYGSVTSAHKYNREQRTGFIESLKQKEALRIPGKTEDKRFGIIFKSDF
ncbi:MAG: hypothetical protein C4522_11640 [Desulfobacteraceae bacterium]|nr:MAG: hypothetical protein C4522_11640 [Desulfobacteraceae bacterium]